MPPPGNYQICTNPYVSSARRLAERMGHAPFLQKYSLYEEFL